MTATSIDEVITLLEQIIQASKTNASPLGYFAGLYQKVTINVKEKLGTGYFENDERMEKLDVVFASRYLEAYFNYQNELPITTSWKVAFESSKQQQLIVLQHLLLGMNAHINLDLGIAAAQVSTPTDIETLQGDFNQINDILGSLIDEVATDLATIWPFLIWILKKLRGAEDFLINFSMTIARNGAWKFAKKLAQTPIEEQDALIQNRDQKVAHIARLIIGEHWMDRWIFRIIRFFERGSVAEKIGALEA